MRTEPPRAFSAETAPPGQRAAFDPLRYCIFATIALIAWVITPAAAAMVFGGLGLGAYVKARRAGLAKSRCVLGDTRLVMAYLAAVCGLGAAFTARALLGLM
ncbi:MAG TPA: hypothetical protein VML96_06835 [Egibacteraceae bacterium]|nr:hypothetical protein [Egibacteraceae bacterium]